jgi:hypothetical protein
MHSMPHISFSGTSEFRPYLPENCQVSAGSFGFELAVYLSKALADKGIYTSYPFCLASRIRGSVPAWFIEYRYTSDLPLKPTDQFFSTVHNHATFVIGISTECNDDDGYSEKGSKNILWHVDIEDAHPPRLTAIAADYAPIKEKLAELIVSALDAKAIESKIDW